MKKYVQITKTLWKLISIVLLSSFFININSTVESQEMKNNKGLFFFSKNDISCFLKRIGYQCFSDARRAEENFQRNSDGTAIRIYDWFDHKGLSINCKGLAIEFTIPGDRAWFNDNNQALSWTKNGEVHYSNGDTEQPPFHSNAADPSYKYFVKGESPVKVFSFKKPKIALAEVNLLGSGVLKIFSKDDKVFLFDYAKASKSSEQIQLKALVLKEINQSLRIVKEITIPFPTSSSRSPYVVDLSPWNETVLIRDHFDWPSVSKWYEYNLQTGEMKKMGKANNFGFYLQCDIFSKKNDIGVKR